MVRCSVALLLACGLAACARLPAGVAASPATVAARAAESHPGNSQSSATAAGNVEVMPAATPAVTLGGIAFHSMQWQVRLATLPAGATQAALQRELQAALDALDDTLTTYRPDSELMRFNAAPVGQWVPASPLLVRALQEAAAVSALSGGAYDVTVGPLVELWGFGAAAAPAAPPSPDAIAAARARVGWERIDVDAARGLLRRQGDVRVDLSSLGEGAGVDALATVLEAAGVRDYLARVAGTSRQRGQRPGGGAWRLGIESPRAGAVPERELAAPDAVVSTSGAYRNVRTIGGRRVSHTLDPATGAPVTHGGVSVTVVLPAGAGAMRADALATALNVLGPDRGLALATREGWAVLYLEREGDGLRERWSPAFAPYLQP